MRKRNVNRAKSVSEVTEEELQTMQDESTEAVQLDREISKSLRTMLGEIRAPDHEYAWLLMKQRLNVQKRLQWKRRTRQLTAAAASFVVAVSLTIGGLAASANILDYYRIVKSVGDGVVHYIFENPETRSDDPGLHPVPTDEYDGNLNDLPDQDAEFKANIERIVSLEEALQQLSNEPLLPTYVPEKFTIDQVMVVPDPLGHGNGQLRMEFRNEEDELVYFVQSPIADNSTRTPFSIYDGAGHSEKVMIGDYEGVLLVNASGGTNLKWTQNGFYMHVSGVWSKEEVLTFAQNLK